MKHRLKLPGFLKNIELPKIKIPSEIIALFVIILLMSLAFFPSFEFTPSDKLTSDQFARQCKKIGYELTDVTADYHADFFQEVISGGEDDCYIGYYTFSHRAYAKGYYTLYLGYFQTGARTEKYTYTSHYNRFYTVTDDRIVFLYRNEEKMIYINGDASHAEAFNELIEKLDI